MPYADGERLGVALKGRVESIGAYADLGAIWILVELMRQRTRGEAVDVEDQAATVGSKGCICSICYFRVVGIVPLGH